MTDTPPENSITGNTYGATIFAMDYGLYGPFPDSIHANSDPAKPNRYVITFIDQRTLWPELCAVSDITAQTVIRTLRQHCREIWSTSWTHFTDKQRQQFHCKINEMILRHFWS
jgi:hypothetical protein